MYDIKEKKIRMMHTFIIIKNPTRFKMKINFTNSANKFIDDALKKNKESLDDIALAIYTRRSIG